VRTWLVVIGTVIALLGAGLLVTLFFLTGGPATTDQVTVQNLGINPDSNWSEVLTPSASVAGSITLSWTASSPVNVSLTPAIPCHLANGYCPSGVPVLSWAAVASGKGTDTHVNSSSYVLAVMNPSQNSITFSGYVTVVFNAASPLPAWGWGVIAGGGIVLLGIGSVATFLGLFLPGGVYSDEDAGTPPVLPPDYVPDDEPADGAAAEPSEPRSR